MDLDLGQWHDFIGAWVYGTQSSSPALNIYSVYSFISIFLYLKDMCKY